MKFGIFAYPNRLYTNHMHNMMQYITCTITDRLKLVFNRAFNNIITNICLINMIKWKFVSLKHIPKELQTPNICDIAISLDGMELQYVLEQNLTPELNAKAVKQNGLALQYVKTQTKYIVDIAVAQNEYAIVYKTEDNKYTSEEIINMYDPNIHTKCTITETCMICKETQAIMFDLNCQDKHHHYCCPRCFGMWYGDKSEYKCLLCMTDIDITCLMPVFHQNE